jgi:two-component sensor histidine kinase
VNPGSDVLSPRVEALDAFVELLSEVDGETPQGEFYNRLCEAVCRLTSMERAVLFLYDDALRRVRAVGAHGVLHALLKDVSGSLEDTPVAARALAGDRVEEISENLELEVPPRYAGFLGITTLTCIPVSAAGRWFGVVFADRGGGRFTLTEGERHVMWTLGKVCALATSARHGERARALSEQIELAREIHQRVIQRLFAVSLALTSDEELSREDRDRCRDELHHALAELRTVLERPLGPTSRDTGTTLRDEIERHAARDDPWEFEWEWSDDAALPVLLEPMAQAFLAEALQNARKHSDASHVSVAVRREDGAIVLEVLNDGVRRQARSRPGMGLRLVGHEAIQHGGMVEFGDVNGGTWRVRLVLPLDEAGL